MNKGPVSARRLTAMLAIATPTSAVGIGDTAPLFTGAS
jgi:hypothetical protein